MIQKIQKYLLENYPLLWNIRIFPLAIIIIITNLFFFGIGYLFTDNDFVTARHYISISDTLGVIYFASVVTGVLILIGWLMHYMRNNAFQVYYPRKTIHIYLEWILCFIICVGITIIPLSLTEGSNKKWRTVCSKNDAKRALEIIDQAEILIPSTIYFYQYEKDYMEPIRIPDGMSVNIDSSNIIDQYAYSKDNKNNLILKGYIGTSLLFYKDEHEVIRCCNRGCKVGSEPPTWLLTEKGKKTKQIKSWLENGEQDKIKALMGEYMKLVEKHKIPTNLTIDSWFDRIYRPPFFPVDSSSVIDDNYSSTIDFDSNYYHNKSYIANNLLYRGYKEILDSYDGTETTSSMVCLYVSLAISVLIFSCRVTDVKKWLQSLVCAGVLILIVSFVAVLISIDNQHLLFAIFMYGTWIVLFIAILIYILNKINNKEYKGKSNILMNIFIWLIPWLLPLSYCIICYLIFDKLDKLDKLAEYIELIFWINIPLTIIFMAFASIFIQKWKGLPDE